MPLSRSVIAIFVVAAAAVSGAALAADAPNSPAGCPAPDAKDAVAFIKNPKWVRQPSGDDVTHYYPPMSYREHKSDRTVVDCAITDDGALQDCTVVDDKRPGKGFDKATLSLTKLYKMPPLSTQAAYTSMPECIRKLGPPHVVIPMDWFAGG